jgi:hypothetical protein
MARRQPEQIGAIRAALRRVAAAIGPLDADRATRSALVQAAFEAADAPKSRQAEAITVSPVPEGKRPRRAGEKSPQSEPTKV